MIKNIFRSFLCLAAVAAVTSCDKDDIYIGGADDSGIISPEGNVVYLTDGNGRSDVGYVEFKDSYTLDLYLRSSKVVEGDASVTLSYDAAVLEAYNAGSGSDVPAFPSANVELPGGGTVTIAGGKTSSEAYKLKLTANASLDPSTVYAVPLSVKPKNASMAGGNESYVVLVQDCTSFPGTDKSYDGKPGMKIVSVIEVNDVNPLNVMGFTLKESGKQFFDIVVLFAANINYNVQTGRVYISRNENVQALLDQRDKYIRPLQDRGIKVVLGVLGNHDLSGISTLQPNLAKEFAAEVKNVCDAYELDGIFLDDEYTDYNAAASGQIPGFCAQSYEAASRLAYEIRKAQPSRLLLSYRYEALYEAVEVDGMQPGKIFDYVLNDYWVTSNPCDTYPGLKISQAGTGSWNCSDYSQCIPANSNWTARFSLEGMREEGYGALMIFNFNVNPDYWLTRYILRDMNEAAAAFWNAELQYDETWYRKDY